MKDPGNEVGRLEAQKPNTSQSQKSRLIFLAIALVLSSPLESCAKQGNSITSRSCVAPSILICVSGGNHDPGIGCGIIKLFNDLCGGGYLRTVLFKNL